MQETSLIAKQIHPASLIKRMLFGSIIALVLIVVFLLSAGASNPEWGKLWILKPLIIVPLAGAAGGFFFHLINRYQGGWKKVLALLCSVIIYIILLWLGTVLGLNGTLWN